uniref:Uncharacterized protein n=1 Tax=Marmota marmota marmota TaxID=9994 RepID=A0A8C5Z9Z1_MARMA
MIRRTTQRPTEKTAAPRHRFFIGSWPEPVSCGGIYLSLIGSRGWGYCARREDSAHWSRDLTLRCWLCPCLWGSAHVLAGH